MLFFNCFLEFKFFIFLLVECFQNKSLMFFPQNISFALHFFLCLSTSFCISCFCWSHVRSQTKQILKSMKTKLKNKNEQRKNQERKSKNRITEKKKFKKSSGKIALEVLEVMKWTEIQEWAEINIKFKSKYFISCILFTKRSIWLMSSP